MASSASVLSNQLQDALINVAEEEETSLLKMGGYKRIENGAYLTWNNLTYKVGNKNNNNEKIILNNISGYVKPGQVLIILGPSGSGKTTLLSILTGILNYTSGHIYYQGKKKLYSNDTKDFMGFNGNATYVTQDDVLLGSLKLQETLVWKFSFVFFIFLL